MFLSSVIGARERMQVKISWESLKANNFASFFGNFPLLLPLTYHSRFNVGAFSSCASVF